MEYLKSEIFLIALTFGVYYLARKLQALTGKLWCHPILISICVIIGFFCLTGITYDDYRPTGHLIEFWLKPAIVALGLPLYTQLQSIKREFWAILGSQLIGCLTGIVSVVLIAKWLGAPADVIVSLAPKSVTTPIAIEISNGLGGIPSLTASIVVLVGLLGAVAGFRILTLGHINSPLARGLSMGTAAHVMGASRASEESEQIGAYATVGLIINGVLTALLSPALIDILIR